MSNKKSFLFVVLIVGFSGIVLQVMLLRELLIIFHGNELSIGIILANWLILEAIGAYFLGRIVENLAGELDGFVILSLIFSGFSPLCIYITRILKQLLGVSQGEALGLIPIGYASFFVILPVSLIHGALFTSACKVYSSIQKEDTTSIGKVYIYETVGTIIGGVSFTYLLIPHFHSFQIALGIAIINSLVCVYLLLRVQKAKILKILSLLLFLTTLLTFGKADKLHIHSIKKQWQGQEVVHYQNSIYGNITVTERGGQYTFFIDGIPTITTPTPNINFVEEFTHLPMLFHPYPREILLIGGGAGGLIYEILKHPSIERIDYTEVDPLILRVVKKFSTPLTETELKDERVNIKYTDGRFFIKRTHHKYDLVFVGISNPSDLQLNRFFTKEFFNLVRERLRKGGILVVSLPGSLTYLSKELRDINSCILNTLRSAYPYIRIIPGDGANLYLASSSPEILSLKSAQLIERLNARTLKTTLISPTYIRYKLHPRWLDWFLECLKGSTSKINKDFTPLGVFYCLSYWNATFSPHTQAFFRLLGKMGLRFFLILTILIVLICLISYKSPTQSIPLCIISTGFAGMIFDLAIIFSFQAFYGYVFHWIGLLVTAFMVGVVIGSGWMTKYLKEIKREIMLFLKIEMGIIVFSAILPVIFLILHHLSPLYLETTFLILSLASGLLVGAQFPLANKIYLKSTENLSRTAGLLYGADLLGGWIGGLIGGVALFPILGLLKTCTVVIILKVATFIILLFTSK